MDLSDICFTNKSKMSKIFQILKNPVKLTALTLLGFFVSFFIAVIAKLVFGESSDSIMNYNPILNGFIHADPSHLIFNLCVLLPLLIFKINNQITPRQFVIVTICISLLASPFSVAYGVPAVGISGTLFFLLSRVCLVKKNWFLWIFFAITFGFEFLNFFNTEDGMAHYVHVIGAVLGFLSLKIEQLEAVRTLSIEGQK